MTRRIEIALAATVLALAVVGASFLPLLTPLYVRSLVSLVGSEELTGLGREDTLAAGELVRRFVVDENAPPLPTELGGRAAFDADASSHLVDVRNVLVPARSVAVAAVLSAAGWLLVRRRDRSLVSAALRSAGWVLAGGAGLAAAFALADFDAFFAWFHSLFFASGTWTFPADALLIQVFPLPFWMTAAGTWALLVFAGTAGLFIIGARTHSTSRTDGV